MLKNLTLYKIEGDWKHTPGDLEEILRKYALTPPSKLSPSSRGWMPVGPSGEYVFSTESQMIFNAGIETKVIPPSTLRREVQAKCDEVEQRMGFKVGKKQKREIKEQVTIELLAKAMTKLSETKVWVDSVNGYLAVDTPSPKKADDILAMLRDHLGELPVVPPEVELSPATAMSQWLTSGKAFGDLQVGDSAEMISADGSKAKVKFAKHELVGCDQVTTHLKSGKSVSALQLESDRVSFVLTDKMLVKSIKYLDPEGAYEIEENADEKDPSVQFEADFRITTGALQGLVNNLSMALGFKD